MSDLSSNQLIKQLRDNATVLLSPAGARIPLASVAGSLQMAADEIAGLQQKLALAHNRESAFRQANDLLKAQMDAMEECIGVKDGQSFGERAEELIVTEVNHENLRGATAEPCPDMPTVARLDSMFAGDDLPVGVHNILSCEITKEQWQTAKAELIARRHGLTAEQVSNARESLLDAVAERVRAAQPPSPDDTEHLDFLSAEYLHLIPFEMPTGAGDADVGWKVLQSHQGRGDVVIAEVYEDSPRKAIEAARSALTKCEGRE